MIVPLISPTFRDPEVRFLLSGQRCVLSDQVGFFYFFKFANFTLNHRS